MAHKFTITNVKPSTIWTGKRPTREFVIELRTDADRLILTMSEQIAARLQEELKKLDLHPSRMSPLNKFE